MKFKLWIHKHDFSEEELVINPRDFNGLQIGDVVEIYHPEDAFSRLLLQVKKLSHDFQQKETISIETTVASTFQLRAYLNVIVNRVDPSHVTLDTLELVFKDQYMGRSDFWRLQRSLQDTCVYMGKKIEFAGLRFQVNEMWVNGEKVACGVVGKDTKLVYRSQSAQIYIFIQMSAEMWEFDFCGELYFEKTVNGFLNELFGKWKEHSCSHDVTIVMFSRTYYSTKAIDDFPKEMQNSTVKGHDGRFYQDFYKTIVSSASVDGWKDIAIKLKTSFNNYLNWIGCEDELLDGQLEGKNSRASNGNMLEALNLALNIFEKYYIDVNLEKTNSTVILLTPGAGVFDVDRELTSMTQQKLMDGGFAVDLVCLAEQPLHAVPLLKFHNKKLAKSKDQVVTVDYNIPQWVNHSFYRSPEQRNASSRFVPRMKVPERPTLIDNTDLEEQEPDEKQEQPYLPTAIDFDEYDAQVFSYVTPQTLIRNRIARNLQKKRNADLRALRKSSPDMVTYGKNMVDGTPRGSWTEDGSQHTDSLPGHRPVRALSECEDIRLGTSVGENMIFIDDDTIGESDSGNYGNVESYPVYQTGLINPFKPYFMSYKLTLFRHLWLHTFPTDPRGEAMQEHHQKVITDQSGISPFGTPYDTEETTLSVIAGNKSFEAFDSQDGMQLDLERRLTNVSSNGDLQKVKSFKKVGSDKSLVSSGRSSSLLFQKAQEQDWTSTILTSVDWKSLSIPACLPLTTEYFPEQKIFENDYYWYNYNVIIDDSYVRPSSDDKCPNRFKMTARDKFLEAISQRVGQGFQFVKNKEKLKFLLSPSKGNRPPVFMPPDNGLKEEHVLSHVQQIHHVQFDGQELSVNKYVRRQLPTIRPCQYKYNLWPAGGKEFQGCCAEFSHVDAVNYNWNYLDHYVTGEGEDCNMLLEEMRYWRVRFLLLPVRDNSHADTKYSGDTKMIEIEGFLRFIEGLNGIKRPENQRMLFLCRKHTAEDKKAYLERREYSDQNGRKTEKSDADNKKPMTPNGSQKKGSTPKESPVEPKKSKRKISFLPDDSQEEPKVPPTVSVSEEDDERKFTIPSKMPPEHALDSNSPLEDVIKAMQNEEYGLSFLPEQAGLRKWTFISAEAVAWMIKSIDTIDKKIDAVQVGQQMLDAKLITHASQSAAQGFVDGMYLFFVNSTEKIEEKTEKNRKISLFTAFGTKKSEEELLMNYNTRWFEVEVWRGKAQEGIPEYLLPNLKPEPPSRRVLRSLSSPPERKAKTDTPGKPEYKSMEYNVDSNNRSDRAEWCIIHYHSNYCPDQSFSLEMHWMVSTASIISERIQHWSRRAITSGFHLVPAPVHPLPIHCSVDATKKHPLSKPSYIPLNIECLLSPGQNNLFEDFEKSTWNRRMVLFQETVLLRFGFLRDYPRKTNTYVLDPNQRREANSNQFVHWTGSVFVRIVDQPIEFTPRQSPNAKELNFDDQNEAELNSYKTSSKRVHLNLNTLLSDLGGDFDDEKYPAGFFWSVNNAITKKWRSNLTGDETSVNKLMTNFGSFCSNKDGLLRRFWDENFVRMTEDLLDAEPTQPES